MLLKYNKYFSMLLVFTMAYAMEEEGTCAIPVDPSGEAAAQVEYLQALAARGECIGRRRAQEIEREVSPAANMYPWWIFDDLRYSNYRRVLAKAVRDEAGFREALSIMDGSTKDLRDELWEQASSDIKAMDLLDTFIVMLRTHEFDVEQAGDLCSRSLLPVYAGTRYSLQRFKRAVACIAGLPRDQARG